MSRVLATVLVFLALGGLTHASEVQTFQHHLQRCLTYRCVQRWYCPDARMCRIAKFGFDAEQCDDTPEASSADCAYMLRKAREAREAR